MSTNKINDYFKKETIVFHQYALKEEQIMEV